MSIRDILVALLINTIVLAILCIACATVGPMNTIIWGSIFVVMFCLVLGVVKKIDWDSDD